MTLSTQTNILPKYSGRIPALDGIRGLAISLVLCWHFLFSPLRGIFPHHHYVSKAIELGRFTWSGVDLFFVLSGFLIGGILLDASRSPSYFSTFYVRRAYRIIPLYFVIIMLNVAVFTRYGGSQVGSGILYYVLFLQNIRMAATDSFGPFGLGMTWSLAVEEQFYLSLPLVVRILSRRILWRVLLVAVVAAPVLRVLAVHFLKMTWVATYVLMPCRADALCLGVLIAIALRSPSVWKTILAHKKYLYAALGLASGVCLWMLIGHFEPFTLQLFGLEYSLFAIVYSLLLTSTLLSASLSSLFSFGPLRFMGVIAYGLYLFESVVDFLFHRLLLHFDPKSGIVLYCVAPILAILATVALAATTWKYFEKPLVKRGHQRQYLSPSESPEEESQEPIFQSVAS